MAKLHWKQRYGDGGVCDFKAAYDFYFKWLLSKTCACFYIKNLPATLDEYYIKSTLLCDGDIAITDIDGKLYAVNGAPGGQPDEYYKPTIYTVANPVLGSKQIHIGQDGVVIYCTPADAYVPGGLFGLIAQTATLLADNIISINCCQINSRVTAMVVADSEAQAVGAEITLKRLYAGKPFQVLRSDLIDKLNISPIASSNVSQNLTELIELHNYIIANYFQSIGVRSNNLRKKSHVLQDEIDVQNDYLQLSVTEIMSSWQAGFDKVNALYGTDITVELNPVLLDSIIDDDISEPEQTAEPEQTETEQTTDTVENEDTETETTDEQTTNEDTTTDNTETTDETTATEIIDNIDVKADALEQIIDQINDGGVENVETNGSTPRNTDG